MSGKRLAIVGVTGRMGTELRALAPEFGFEVSAGVSGSSAGEGLGFPLHSSIADLVPANVDIVIDFSLPEATEKVLDWCSRHGKPLVSGVTGLTEKQKAAFSEASRKSAVLWSPNMSLGVAVLARMLSQLKNLQDFEFQIEELHHKRKKDRPSGTALFLQQRLEEAVGEVPEPVAIRGGGIFGIHRVWAMGEEETITLEHTAMNRRVFARGALKAASWLLGKPAGLYRMDDVLGT